MEVTTKYKIEFVDLKRQYESLKKEIDTAIHSCIDQTRFIGGTVVTDFAENFAAYCDVKYCIPCANGTDALEIGIKALGIGEGAEVIVPVNSFVASAEAVSNNGAEVVFCDIDPYSYNINPTKIESLITPRTRAIMPVHLYGRVADMDPIMDIAKKYHLLIIEDASQAHGALYKGRKAGAFGDLATFSFFPGKNLGAYGDAGAIVTNNEKTALLCKKIANHGRIAKYDHDMIGRNSRMDSIQAAILNVKLKYIEQWIHTRFRIAQWYHKALKGIPQIHLPKDRPDERSAYHLYVIRVPKEHRQSLQQFLKENDIATGIHYPITLATLDAYAFLKHQPEDFSVASSYVEELLSLPIFPELTEKEVKYVGEKVRAYFEGV